MVCNFVTDSALNTNGSPAIQRVKYFSEAPKPAPRGTRNASASKRTGKPGTKEDTQLRDDTLWVAEASRLGAGPAKWVRVQEYWSETDDANEEETLDGYEYGTPTRRDLKTLKEGGELTGDIASEIARRL